MLFEAEKFYTKQSPKILQYWITNEISPCIKENIIKIITNKPSKNTKNKK